MLPAEVIIVDGAPESETETDDLIRTRGNAFPFRVRYLRHARGTAIQRNAGVDIAEGSLIALIDDDVRLEPDFLQSMFDVFSGSENRKVGGVVGYRTNQHFTRSSRQRWRWYHRLGLLTTFEPGRYDFQTGYPVNANMQPPFSGVREVDFMTTACAVWRREVFDSGLRFDSFFRDYGVLEDAHFALRAGRTWNLLQCGDARCRELSSPNGRVNRRKLGYKSVVNYYYVFRSIAGPLTRQQKLRFWRYQAFELFRIVTSAVRRHRMGDLSELLGRLEGVWQVVLGTAFTR
jgi:glycosyltransferase involved in cell wall biosynthesis